MKTAISLPDDLFEVADKYATDNGLSRSALYAHALREFLDRHRTDDLKDRINAAIDKAGQPRDALLSRVANKALLGQEW